MSSLKHKKDEIDADPEFFFEALRESAGERAKKQIGSSNNYRTIGSWFSATRHPKHNKDEIAFNDVGTTCFCLDHAGLSRGTNKSRRSILNVTAQFSLN
jgi:hypothetical protein